jgi:hypothetical protein
MQPPEEQDADVSATRLPLKEMTAGSYESYLIVNISFNGFRDQFRMNCEACFFNARY